MQMIQVDRSIFYTGMLIDMKYKRRLNSSILFIWNGQQFNQNEVAIGEKNACEFEIEFYLSQRDNRKQCFSFYVIKDTWAANLFPR